MLRTIQTYACVTIYKCIRIPLFSKHTNFHLTRKIPHQVLHARCALLYKQLIKQHNPQALGSTLRQKNPQRVMTRTIFKSQLG
ncbi:hypothetical protein GALL_501540 [mine drainage metagenome]|uniref:Uncharacterized protein n=1 Tax=mine drainage metagenome TaxID=410659 RepID=A0A1J5P9H3_9ZZZZ